MRQRTMLMQALPRSSAPHNVPSLIQLQKEHWKRLPPSMNVMRGHMYALQRLQRRGPDSPWSTTYGEAYGTERSSGGGRLRRVRHITAYDRLEGEAARLRYSTWGRNTVDGNENNANNWKNSSSEKLFFIFYPKMHSFLKKKMAYETGHSKPGLP